MDITKAAPKGTAETLQITFYFSVDMEYFGPMNEVYAEEFKAVYPARCAFAVKELPKKALVEIEVIAAL